MKMRMIKLRPEFIIETLQGKAASFTSNLPSNIELLDMKYDLFSKQVFAIIRSDSFEDIAESYPIPEFNLVYAPSSKTESQPTTSFKTESNPAKKTLTQTSRGTSAIEKEFSPEQRKLLSFTVDGEYVKVAPTQYLKDEWNEISDVVRSLGGKWVKGDVVSFWAIPLQQT
jgi:hypothetical protein